MTRTEPSDPIEHLRRAIDHAGHLLPIQGPITVFVAQNTLQAFEHLPFFEGVKLAAEKYQCEPLLLEERYRAELLRGRIRTQDVEAVLRENLGDRANEPICFGCTRLMLQLEMLQYAELQVPASGLHWFVAETDALLRIREAASAPVRARLIAETRRWAMRDLRGDANQRLSDENATQAFGNHFADSLLRLAVEAEDWQECDWEAFTLQAIWSLCCRGAKQVPGAVPQTSTNGNRHRDLLKKVTAVDVDLPVHDLLIRFCGSYLDQGMSRWLLPDRAAGFYRAFCELYRNGGVFAESWQHGLPAELSRLMTNNVPPLECILESLNALGVPAEEWDEFLSKTVLALPGWGGMLKQVEIRGVSVPHPIQPGSLIDFLAVRLLLDRWSIADSARQTFGYNGALSDLRTVLSDRIPPPPPPSVEERAFVVFQLAQVLGWTPLELDQLHAEQWAKLLHAVESFSPMERRQTFHSAYERRLREQSLDAIGLHPRYQPATPARPRFQLVTCLDEREESFRRHIEEIAPDCETFGAAGFYGVAMYYQGAADAYFVPLCPIVLTPKHWVKEEVNDEHVDSHNIRARMRRGIGSAYYQFETGSRTAFLGALFSAGVGVLASVPLVGRVLFPTLAAKFQRLFGRAIAVPPATRLRLQRIDADPTAPASAEKLGFQLEEMADIAERQLRDIGLVESFARLIFILGHDSISLNNPHRSAYDCGACGGGSGAPNGRAIAQILNNYKVRERLSARGLKIPDDTHFVGGCHNTCTDSVRLFDVSNIPETHRADVDAIRSELWTAGCRNAHERSRRFLSAGLTMSHDEARQHVEERSQDLAQTRPELGHATNAMCIVGRRERTRGLFLDRRAFMASYDATTDGLEAPILTRILGAAVPVCGGISLTYFFSHVDNSRFGCGSKLPHNITAQLGVMDGAASDLRTGLPWQMVELHEPVRLLFVIETRPEVMLGIMDRNPNIGGPIRNGWVQVSLLDPESSQIHVYQDGAFQAYESHSDSLPVAATSTDWYRGWRDHLEIAEIRGRGMGN